jgi:hypothetical protein
MNEQESLGTEALCLDQKTIQIKRFQAIMPVLLLLTMTCSVAADALHKPMLNALVLALLSTIALLIWVRFRPSWFYHKIKEEKYSKTVSEHWLTRLLCSDKAQKVMEMVIKVTFGLMLFLYMAFCSYGIFLV